MRDLLLRIYMGYINFLNVMNKNEFRKWLEKNLDTEKECWIEVKRDRFADDNTLYYIDTFMKYWVSVRLPAQRKLSTKPLGYNGLRCSEKQQVV